MKKSTRFFTHALMAFLLLVGVSAFAQKKGIESRAKSLTDSMKVQLTLTDEQYTKVQAINLDFMNKAKALKGETGDRKSRATELKGWAEERDAALQKVLTTEQFGTYKVNKEAHRKAMKSQRKKRPA